MTEHRTRGWLVPALMHTGVVGTLGIVAKLAVDDSSWQQVVLATSAAYIVVGIALLLHGQRLGFNRYSVFAAGAGLLAGMGMISLSLALEAGEVATVVPITSIYPLVTLALASKLLSEEVGWPDLVDTLLIISGVVLITSA